MVRKSSFGIGLGLALLWAIGLGLNSHATMLWFNAVAAIVAFGIAALVEEREGEHNPANAFGPALLGLGLAVLWVVGVASHEPRWVSWLNFLFALACFAVAIMALSGREVHIHSHSHARA
jgi:hypothetical protein